MANDGIDTFLQAEEQAHRLVEELARLKTEADSYKAARKAIDQAADGVSTLVNSLSDISGRLAGVVEILRTIGTPELLRGQEAITGNLVALRQDLSTTQRSVTEAIAQPVAQLGMLQKELAGAQQANQAQLQQMEQKVLTVKEDLGARVTGCTAKVTTVRKLVIASIGLSLTTLALAGWLLLILIRG